MQNILIYSKTTNFQNKKVKSCGNKTPVQCIPFIYETFIGDKVDKRKNQQNNGIEERTDNKI